MKLNTCICKVLSSLQCRKYFPHMSLRFNLHVAVVTDALRFNSHAADVIDALRFYLPAADMIDALRFN